MYYEHFHWSKTKRMYHPFPWHQTKIGDTVAILYFSTSYVEVYVLDGYCFTLFETWIF